jgi:hypothetical protein
VEEESSGVASEDELGEAMGGRGQMKKCVCTLQTHCPSHL